MIFTSSCTTGHFRCYLTSEYYPDITMKDINRNCTPTTPQFKFTRGSDMTARNFELVQRIAQFPEVLGILCHGSFSANPHHETDESSDLDLTVIVDGPVGNTRPYMPGFNFKSYQAMPDGKPLEVDVYLFNINDTRNWDVATREGYAASATLVFDRDGRCQKWLEEKVEMTPGFRNQQISTLLENTQALLEETRTFPNPLDQRLSLSKAVKRLVEAVYYFNWTYPADYKWRVSGAIDFEWKPVEEIIDLLKECNSTRDIDEARTSTENFFSLLKAKAEKEGISTSSCTTCPATDKAPLRKEVAIARLFTRVDKYSAHSIKKCAKRFLPRNAHDLVWEGIDNCVDIIYLLNGVESPKTGKIEGLKALEWRPRDLPKLLYQAGTVQNYGNGNDALLRAAALREIFESIKEKIREENLFSIASLYDEDFMNEDLFGERSPYMLVYKGGQYLNRQQEEDTYAEKLLKRMGDVLTQREKNYLWGLCSQYFVGSDEEFTGLANEQLAPEYLPVWKEVVKKF